MIQKKNGFTLVELLAVIVILAVIILIGGTSTMGIINKARKSSALEMRKNLADAALTYVFDKSIKLPKCEEEFSRRVESGHEEILESQVGSCAVKISGYDLKREGYFDDDKNACTRDNVIVYRYNSEGNSEYRTYVNNDACTH